VLVVDDEPLVRWSLGEALKQRGYEVLEAGDGRQALACADTGADLAILDYKLPDTDGLALLEEIRRRRPACRIMLLTGYRTDELVSAAHAGGAFRVCGKPYDVELVIRDVERALAEPNGGQRSP
jgi:two-component system NtrC family response regulator